MGIQGPRYFSALKKRVLNLVSSLGRSKNNVKPLPHYKLLGPCFRLLCILSALSSTCHVTGT